MNNNRKVFYGYIIASMLLSLITSLWGLKSADMIYELTGDYRYSYYWMDPQLAPIRYVNNMVMISGFSSCALGIYISKKKITEFIEYNLKVNMIGIIIGSFLTWLCLFVVQKFNNSNLEFNNLYRTSILLVSYYIFVLYWTAVGYLVKLIMNNKLISLIFLFSIHVFELFFAPYFGIVNILKYFPATLSRELIFKQFPFWIKGTWAEELKVFSYANVNSIYSTFSASIFYIYGMLFISLMSLYVLYLVKNKGVRYYAQSRRNR